MSPYVSWMCMPGTYPKQLGKDFWLSSPSLRLTLEVTIVALDTTPTGKPTTAPKNLQPKPHIQSAAFRFPARVTAPTGSMPIRCSTRLRTSQHGVQNPLWPSKGLGKWNSFHGQKPPTNVKHPVAQTVGHKEPAVITISSSKGKYA